MPEHLSVSQIGDFCHCPERWRLKHNEKIPEPSSPQVIRGRSVDAAVNADMRHKREHGVLMERRDVEALAYDTVAAEFRHGEVLAKGSIRAAEGETKDVAVSLASLHHTDVAPAIEPVAIQQEITLQMGDQDGDLPPIVGVIDLTDKAGRVRDTKTSGRRPADDQADISDQLTQYFISYEALNSKPPTALVLDNLVWYKPSGKNPRGKGVYLPQETTRGPAQIVSYINKVKAVNAAMKAGIAIPADINSWKCSPRWCGFFGGACRYTRGVRKGDGSY